MKGDAPVDASAISTPNGASNTTIGVSHHVLSSLRQASICLQCDNVFGDVGDEALVYNFNVEAPISRQLLAELQHAVGGLPNS